MNTNQDFTDRDAIFGKGSAGTPALRLKVWAQNADGVPTAELLNETSALLEQVSSEVDAYDEESVNDLAAAAFAVRWLAIARILNVTAPQIANVGYEAIESDDGESIAFEVHFMGEDEGSVEADEATFETAAQTISEIICQPLFIEAMVALTSDAAEQESIPGVTLPDFLTDDECPDSDVDLRALADSVI